jgi:hypothetical protein
VACALECEGWHPQAVADEASEAAAAAEAKAKVASPAPSNPSVARVCSRLLHVLHGCATDGSDPVQGATKAAKAAEKAAEKAAGAETASVAQQAEAAQYPAYAALAGGGCRVYTGYPYAYGAQPQYGVHPPTHYGVLPMGFEAYKRAAAAAHAETKPKAAEEVAHKDWCMHYGTRTSTGAFVDTLSDPRASATEHALARVFQPSASEARAGASL